MLVLSRRPQEKIVFPQLEIEVEVLGVSGNTVRIGVNAPREVLVLRNEVAEKDAARGAPSAAKAPAAKPATNCLAAAHQPAISRPAAAGRAAVQPSEAVCAAHKWMHQLRNHLNTASLAMQVAQSQLVHGEIADADAKMQMALEQLNALEAALSNAPVLNGVVSNRPTSADAAYQNQFVPRPAETMDASADANQSAAVRRAPLALVVDDNADDSALLASVLRSNGFRVETASDGCHALDYLATHKQPDVVLLDMRMPRCDGPTTISKIRSNPQLNGLRVVAVSGWRSSEVGVSTGPQGVDRWFCKPFDPRRLVHELKHDLRVSTRATLREKGR